MNDRERFFFLLYDLFSRCLDCLTVWTVWMSALGLYGRYRLSQATVRAVKYGKVDCMSWPFGTLPVYQSTSLPVCLQVNPTPCFSSSHSALFLPLIPFPYHFITAQTDRTVLCSLTNSTYPSLSSPFSPSEAQKGL